MKTLTIEQIERLHDIREEIKELAREAYKLVEDTSEEARSKGYWYAQVLMACDDDHSYLGSCSATLASVTDNLDTQRSECGSEEEEDEEDEEGDSYVNR